MALRPVHALYATQEAVEFGPRHLKVVRQRMVDDGLSRTGTNARIKRIVRMFRWAAEEELLPASVYETLRLVSSLKRGKTPAWETESVRPVPMEIVWATQACLPRTIADMVGVQHLTGCRPQDVCQLTPGCIDNSEPIWVATPIDHKTSYLGCERRIYIGPKAQKIISPYMSRDGDTCLFTPAEAVQQRREARLVARKTPMSCGNRSGKRSGGLRGQKAKKKPGETSVSLDNAPCVGTALNDAPCRFECLRYFPSATADSRAKRIAGR